MNQAILFNDDHRFDHQQGCWCFSGMLAGEKITIALTKATDAQITIDNDVIFDWEAMVEDWLEDNEPENGWIIVD